MPSISTEGRPAGSGIVVRPGGCASRSGRWTWLREERGRHLLFRAGVSLVGLLLILAGAAMCLLSALLAIPPVFLGVWVWSREFHWGHELSRAFGVPPHFPDTLSRATMVAREEFVHRLRKTLS